MKFIASFVLTGCYCFIFQAVMATPLTYIIGVENNNVNPYSEFKDNKYSGFNRELLDLFAQHHEYNFIYKALPIKRLNRDVLLGEIDFRFPDNAYWIAEAKHNKKIYYSQPVVRFIDGVLVRPEQKGKGLENLKSLGIMLGYTPAPYQQMIDFGQLKVSANSDSRRLINQVVRGKHSGMYANVAAVMQQIELISDDADALVFDPDLPHVVSTMHLSTIKYPEVIADFNRFLENKLLQIDQLKIKYRVEELPLLK